MTIEEAFGKAVKLRRIEMDLSQDALADEARMARSFISGIERGKANASVSSVFKLSQALKLKPSDLWRKAEALYDNKNLV